MKNSDNRTRVFLGVSSLLAALTVLLTASGHASDRRHPGGLDPDDLPPVHSVPVDPETYYAWPRRVSTVTETATTTSTAEQKSTTATQKSTQKVTTEAQKATQKSTSTQKATQKSTTATQKSTQKSSS